MSLVQKGAAFSALAIATLIVAAGVFGPSAYSVANAQAQESINRAFAHHANLSNEEMTKALAEAQAAPDLRVVSADEMPMHGFIGNLGRTFGFKMTERHKNFEEKLANLPEDVRQKIEEYAALREEMKPETFMVYTNAEGQKVLLGLNASDEPVVTFVQHEM